MYGGRSLYVCEYECYVMLFFLLFNFVVVVVGVSGLFQCVVRRRKANNEEETICRFLCYTAVVVRAHEPESII